MTTDPLVPPLREETTTTWHVAGIDASGDWTRDRGYYSDAEAAEDRAKAIGALFGVRVIAIVRRTTTITEEIA